MSFNAMIELASVQPRDVIVVLTTALMAQMKRTVGVRYIITVLHLCSTSCIQILSYYYETLFFKLRAQICVCQVGFKMLRD